MLKTFILGLLALLGVVYATLLAKDDPGYALLSYGDWSVEMTIVLLIASLGSVIILAFISIFLISKFLDIPGKFFTWNKKRKIKSASKHSIKGFIHLVEGNWKAAEHALNKNISSNEMSLLNYLSAAKAAQQQGKQDSRNDYLAKAFQHFPEAEVAIGIAQAELELKDNQDQQALITLLHLRTIVPNHKRVLLLLQELYKKTSSWKELEILLKDLKSYRVLESNELKLLEKEVLKRLFRDYATQQKEVELTEYWNKIERSLRIDIEMSCYYSELLIELKNYAEAAKVIKAVLKREWSDEAIAIYSNIQEEDSAKQLVYAEKFLEQHSENSVLLFSLGKISLLNQLWGKARDYIQESVDLAADSTKYYVLGNLYESQLDDKEKALDCYREGLLLAEPTRISVPITETRAETIAETIAIETQEA